MIYSGKCQILFFWLTWNDCIRKRATPSSTRVTHSSYIILSSVSFVLWRLMTNLSTSLRYSCTFYRNQFAISICLSGKLNIFFKTLPRGANIGEAHCGTMHVADMCHLPTSHPGNLHIGCARNTRNTREIHATCWGRSRGKSTATANLGFGNAGQLTEFNTSVRDTWQDT